MAKYKVKTPNPNFNGERLGCKFADGQHVCTCNDERLIEQFKQWGYSVEKIEDKQKEVPKVDEPKEQPRKRQTRKK